MIVIIKRDTREGLRGENCERRGGSNMLGWSKEILVMKPLIDRQAG